MSIFLMPAILIS